MTPGRTCCDLRRLRGEESSGFLERRPSQPDQPRGSFLHPVAPRASPTRGPPPAPGADPSASPCPAVRPAPPSPDPSLALSDSHLVLGLPQCPAPPSPSAHFCPPGHVARPPARCGSAGPPRPRLQSPGAPSPSTPPRPRRSSESPGVVPEDSLWRAALSGDWPPRRREAPPPPPSDLVSLMPAAAASPAPPSCGHSTPSPVTPGSVQRPLLPRRHRPALGGAALSGGLQSGSQLPGPPPECGTKFSLSGSGALLGWLRGAGWAESAAGWGRGPCASLTVLFSPPSPAQ